VIRYALAAAVIALIATAGWGMLQSQRADRWQERTAAAEIEAALWQAEAETRAAMASQAKDAAAELTKELERVTKAAAQFDTIRDAIREDQTDDPLPAVIRDALERLRTRNGDPADAPSNP
jgi:uncharacterized protein HemX